jgi:hypothetical protein
MPDIRERLAQMRAWHAEVHPCDDVAAWMPADIAHDNDVRALLAAVEAVLALCDEPCRLCPDEGPHPVYQVHTWHGRAKQARAYYCDRCPVRADCLDTALDEETSSTGRPVVGAHFRHGLRGGLLPAQRLVEALARREAATA